METAAMIAVAVALDIAQPEIELGGQALEHRLVGTGAETVSVDEVQQRLAGRLTVPATQGETGGTRMGPGHQLHRISPYWPLSLAIRLRNGTSESQHAGKKKPLSCSGRRKTFAWSNLATPSEKSADQTFRSNKGSGTGDAGRQSR